MDAHKISLLVLMLLLLSVLSTASYAFETVNLNGLVNDYANIINDTSEQELNGILKQVYDSGVAEYTIVTIKSLDGVAIEDYSLKMVQDKLGNSQKDNGLSLLVAVDDHQYRFEVGRGLEYILNDAKVGRIGRTYLVPNFRLDDYNTGIVQASLAVKTILLNDTSSDYYVNDSMSDEELVRLIIILAIIFFFAVVPIIVLLVMRSKGKKDGSNKYFDAAMAAVWLFGRGGSGGFSGGSGFGGFGGGSFGGGGASGGW